MGGPSRTVSPEQRVALPVGRGKRLAFPAPHPPFLRPYLTMEYFPLEGAQPVLCLAAAGDLAKDLTFGQAVLPTPSPLRPKSAKINSFNSFSFGGSGGSPAREARIWNGAPFPPSWGPPSCPIPHLSPAVAPLLLCEDGRFSGSGCTSRHSSLFPWVRPGSDQPEGPSDPLRLPLLLAPGDGGQEGHCVAAPCPVSHCQGLGIRTLAPCASCT